MPNDPRPALHPGWVLRTPPPVWAVAALLAAIAAQTMLPAFAVPVARSAPGGLLLFLCGFALAAWGRVTFARAGTEILPASRINSKLVETGPFRYSRNPMYLGTVVLALGIALWVGTLPFYLVAVFLFALLAGVFIPYEEGKMERQHGDAYRAYKSRVRRWV